MSDTKVVTAHLPIELAERVDAYAEQMDRSRGWIVKQALADWVAWEEEKERRTLKGLADGAAGRVVPHDKVAAWMESLGTDNPLPRPRSSRK